MTNKNYKDILGLINKLAQDISPTWTVPASAPAVGGVIPAQRQNGKSGPAAIAVNAKIEVKEMQLAMQSLAKAVIQDSLSETMRNKSPSDSTPIEAPDPQKKAKKSFNDFIASNYIGGLDEDQKGVEWSQDTSVNTYQKKQVAQSDIYELDVVMHTLKMLGGQKSEMAADGVWSFRTDNALRNIMGFATALLQLEGDFALNNGNIYTSDNLRALKQSLSGYTVKDGVVNLSAKRKKERASDITKHLKGITKLYNNFRAQVTAKPEYRPLIEGDRAFDSYSYKGSNADNLTSEEKTFAFLDDSKLEGVNYYAPNEIGRKMTYIPYKALTSKSAYMAWMVDHIGVTAAIALKIFETVVKPTILNMTG